MLFAGAIVALGYCALVLADRSIFEHREQQRLERLLHDQPEATNENPAAIALPAFLRVIGPDGLIGRLEIPRLGVSVMVVEGTGDPLLRRAAGHIAGTALPGEPGNVGIAAHRDTFFRPLRNIRGSDVITLTTGRATYRYRVVSTKIVSPADVAVLESDGTAVLTLVTCYPFYFIGAAPKRFIVRAEKLP